MLPVAGVLLVLALRTAVGVNEAVGDEGQQLLLRHLARIRVQADHVLQQQHVTDGEERAGPVVVLVDDGGAAAEEVNGPRLVHHLGGLERLRGLRLGIQRAERRRGRRERGRVRGHGSPPRSPGAGGLGHRSPSTGRVVAGAVGGGGPRAQRRRADWRGGMARRNRERNRIPRRDSGAPAWVWSGWVGR